MNPHDHLVNHIHHPELRSDNILHVIGVITNPVRFHSRYRLFRKWYEEMSNTPNVEVYVVEAAYGDRKHECTEEGNPKHLQLRFWQDIWLKENLINLAVKRLLPHKWRYMCWSDTDIHFRNNNWALEALHCMQHYKIMQPWSDCMDLGFSGNILEHHKSFCYQHRRGVPKQVCHTENYEFAHTGYVWCARRDFYEAVGGLIDWSILGSADHHMGWGLINKIRQSIPNNLPENFSKLACEWERRAYQACHGHVGFLKGTIEHYFHGPKSRKGAGRQYQSRWQILQKHKFDPLLDLTYDHQGLVTLVNKVNLVNDIREYMFKRLEDSIEDH